MSESPVAVPSEVKKALQFVYEAIDEAARVAKANEAKSRRAARHLRGVEREFARRCAEFGISFEIASAETGKES